MASMKAANRLKAAFEEAKGPSMGCWQMIPGANVSRTLARTGVDWVLVDCEHGNMDGELSGGSLSSSPCFLNASLDHCSYGIQM